MGVTSCKTEEKEIQTVIEEQKPVEQEQPAEEEVIESQEEQEKTEEPEILVDKEYDGVLFENVPENYDLKEIKQELDLFFYEYEQTVLSKDYDKWVTMISEA
jgi:hypothetical protein